jgi:Cu+-exporting ATPase
VDGEVMEGASTVDESDAHRRTDAGAEVSEGDHVTGGTLNKNGSFVMKAVKVGEDTMLSHIVEMVASAQRSRAPIQGLADKVASYFVPAVVAVAIIAFVAWLTLGAISLRFVFAIVRRSRC